MVWTALWGVASAKPIPDGVIVEGPPEEHHPHEQVTVRFVVCHDRCGRSGEACVSGPRCRCEGLRSEEHTSELQSLMRISYAVFCLKKKKKTQTSKTNEKLT